MSDSQEFFYEGGGRRDAIDAIFESIHRSDALVLLEGPSGCGRSALLERFLVEADPDVLAIARVNGDILMSADQCFALLTEALGAPPSGQDERGALLDGVALVREAGRLPVLLVDDAHELGEETRAALMGLAREAYVTLVMAGDETLEASLERDLQPARILLRAFDADESEDFVAAWLAVDDEDELPSHRAIAKLHRQSKGLPGRLVELLEAGAARRTPLLPNGFPVWHVALTVVALALLLWLLARIEPGEESSAPVTPAEIPLALPAPGSAADADAAAGVVPGNRAVAVAVPRPVVVNGYSPEEPSVPATVVAPSAPVTVVAPAIPARPSANGTAIALPSPKAIAPVPVPAPVAEPQKVVKRYSADEESLLKERAAGYTLQLFASFNEEAVRQFRAKHAAAGVRTFRTVREELPWYVAVTGTWRNKEDAKAAIGKLPAELQKLKPWARSFQGIQDELRRRKD